MPLDKVQLGNQQLIVINQVIRPGKILAIYGWSEEDHTSATKELEGKSYVDFYTKDTVPDRVDIDHVGYSYIVKGRLTTRQCHNLRSRDKIGRSPIPGHISSQDMTVEEILKILEAFSKYDSLAAIEPRTPVASTAQNRSPVPRPSERAPKPTARTYRTRQEKENQPALVNFASDFLQEARRQPDGLVSRNTVSRLVKKHQILFTVGQLVKSAYLEGKLGNRGKRIGSYCATAKLKQLSHVEEKQLVVSSEASIEQPKETMANFESFALSRLSARSELVAERERLEQRISDINQQLTFLDRLEEVLQAWRRERNQFHLPKETKDPSV